VHPRARRAEQAGGGQPDPRGATDHQRGASRHVVPAHVVPAHFGRCHLVAQAQLDPEFGARFRASFLARRRAALAVITDRARARGDLPAAASPDLVADIVFGVIWYRVLARDEPLDGAAAAALPAALAALLAGSGSLAR
jgi:hypothetical protein